MKRNSLLLTVLCFVVLSLASVARAQDAQVAGSWDLSSPGRDGSVRTQTLTLQQDGTKLTGAIKGQRGDAPVTGSVSGNNITFTVTRTTPNGDMKMDYTGTVDGDSMKGTFSVMGNTVNWTAKKSAAGGNSGGGN